VAVTVVHADGVSAEVTVLVAVLAITKLQRVEILHAVDQVGVRNRGVVVVLVDNAGDLGAANDVVEADRRVVRGPVVHARREQRGLADGHYVRPIDSAEVAVGVPAVAVAAVVVPAAAAVGVGRRGCGQHGQEPHRDGDRPEYLSDYFQSRILLETRYGR